MPLPHFHIGDQFGTERYRDVAERLRGQMVAASRAGHPEVPEVRECRCASGERVLLERAAPRLRDLLEAAIARVQIANDEGDRILSAWLPDAEAAILDATGKAVARPEVRRLFGDVEAEINARLGLDEDEECSECGEPLTDDGEGFADLCPTCADKSEPPFEPVVGFDATTPRASRGENFGGL